LRGGTEKFCTPGPPPVILVVMGFLSRALFLGLLCCAQEKKLQPPDPAAEKKAEREIRDVFRDEYSKKTPGDRVALVRLLLDQGVQTHDDLPARYVLFREARDLASASGDLRSALRAVDEMSKSFEIDAPASRGSVLAATATAARTPEDFQAIVDQLLGLAEDALAAERFDAAEKWSSEAVSAAKKAKSLPLASRADAKAKEISERKATFETLKKARQTLASTPNDPDANLAAGRAECFQRGNWTAGLPLLAKGSDAALRELATKDLAQPTDADDQVALGDRWWELADQQPAPAKGVIRMRASSWYSQALARVTGLTKARIDARRREAADAATVDLLRLIDLKKDVVRGEWAFEGSSLICLRSGPAARVQIPYLPPEEYEVTVVAERMEGVEAINVGLTKGGVKFHMVIDGWAQMGYFSGLSLIEGKYANQNETSKPGRLLTNKQPSTIECSVRNSALKMTVDGKVIFEWTGDVQRLSNYNVLNTPHPRALYISGWDTKYRFSKIVLTPLSGAGEKLR
jgi:hypothetical protein